MKITPDMIFSYWLLLWYILYISHIIPYSPKIWFIFAILFMIGMICLMVYNNSPLPYIILFIVAFILFKGIPFYTMRNDPYQTKDVVFGLVLVIFYLLWLQYKKVNIFKIYSYESFKDMPFVHYFFKLFK